MALQPDEDFWQNPVAPVAASLYQRLPLGDPEEIPAGSLFIPIRASQDLTLALAQSTAALRASQDVILVLGKPAPGENYWQNPTPPVPAVLYQRLPLGDPEEIPAATLALGQPDEDYWQNPATPVPALLYQRLPIGDPEEISAATLVGFILHPDEDYWQNPTPPTGASLWQRLPLGDPEEIPAGRLLAGQPDEDYWQNPAAPVPARIFQRLPLGDPEEIPAGYLVSTLFASQDLVLALAQSTAITRASQDVVLVIATPPPPQPDEDFWRNAVAPIAASLWQRLPVGDPEEIPAGSLRLGQPDEDLWRNPTRPVAAALYQNLPYLFDEAVWTWIPPPKSYADKPSIQLHPLRKPLDFYTKPLTQPGRKSASFTTLLTEAGAQRAFSMPLGARNQPVAGKVFSFTMGGLIIPGRVGGMLTITPLYGASANGVNLGSSLSQAYSASATPIPWRLKGEIIFRAVDLTPGASLVVCTGSFAMQSLVILFGSAIPIQVDVSAISASASGALNFAASFAPSVLNVTPPTISAKYAFLRAI